MLYGFAINDNSISVYRWNPENNKAEHVATGMEKGLIYIKNRLFLVDNGFILGESAVEKLGQTEDAAAGSSYVGPVCADLYKTAGYCQAGRNNGISGSEIADRFFKFFGELLNCDNTTEIIVQQPYNINNHYAAFRKSVSHIGARAGILPGWFLKLSSCILTDKQTSIDGNVLFIDIGDAESCIGVFRVKYLPEEKQLSVRPVFIRTYTCSELSHMSFSRLIAEKNIPGYVGYGNNFIPSGSDFFRFRDSTVILSATEATEKQLSAGRTCDLTVSGVNINGSLFWEKKDISPQWFLKELDNSGYIPRLCSGLNDAFNSVGGTDSLARIIISKDTGRLLRKQISRLLKEEIIAPERKSAVHETAEGGALILGHMHNGWNVQLQPQIKTFFSVSLSFPDGRTADTETRPTDNYCFFKKKYIPGCRVQLQAFRAANAEERRQDTVFDTAIPVPDRSPDSFQVTFTPGKGVDIRFINKGTMLSEHKYKF